MRLHMRYNATTMRSRSPILTSREPLIPVPRAPPVQAGGHKKMECWAASQNKRRHKAHQEGQRSAPRLRNKGWAYVQNAQALCLGLCGLEIRLQPAKHEASTHLLGLHIARQTQSTCEALVYVTGREAATSTVQSIRLDTGTGRGRAKDNSSLTLSICWSRILACTRFGCYGRIRLGHCQCSARNLAARRSTKSR